MDKQEELRYSTKDLSKILNIYRIRDELDSIEKEVGLSEYDVYNYKELIFNETYEGIDPIHVADKIRMYLIRTSHRNGIITCIIERSEPVKECIDGVSFVTRICVKADLGEPDEVLLMYPLLAFLKSWGVFEETQGYSAIPVYYKWREKSISSYHIPTLKELVDSIDVEAISRGGYGEDFVQCGLYLDGLIALSKLNGEPPVKKIATATNTEHGGYSAKEYNIR